MRPQLTLNSEMMIEMFLDRKLYKSQAEIIEVALNLLYEKQLESDSLIHSQERKSRHLEDVFELQLQKPRATKKKAAANG